MAISTLTHRFSLALQFLCLSTLFDFFMKGPGTGFAPVNADLHMYNNGKPADSVYSVQAEYVW